MKTTLHILQSRPGARISAAELTQLSTLNAQLVENQLTAGKGSYVQINAAKGR